MKTLKMGLWVFGVIFVVTGLVYPLLVTVGATALFPHQAGGSIIERDGILLGSELIGQEYKTDGFFHGRASASAYDAQASGGSNLSPHSRELQSLWQQRAAALNAHNPGNSSVPGLLVTASGSGLDPHISPEAAYWQLGRVAKARGVSEARLKALIDSHIRQPPLPFIGQPTVNVSLLNLALSKME
ncbi:potassium-transporting ATPase subunit KdpC [Shewanella algae]|uniref:potassium-transporting ATPase subunit KdpC n=1 Tax=Shewanella algae TaxID=38313 RepID=UPI001F1C4045|nr:potassium-transporting ATPase subunit KdpC [Shewanella algae]MCE9781181.1 potassium-transporting ATPase subunit KdpC [Shewanella algae]MCE9825400.1 potassium-transporting ATPase subunit KdpC [Shewanella algae]